MKAIYKTSEALGHFTQVRDYCDGNWVCLIAPTPEEVQDVSAHYGIELQDLVLRWTKTSAHVSMPTTSTP